MSRSPMKRTTMLAAMIALGTGSLAGQEPDLRPGKGSAFAAGAAGAGGTPAERAEYALHRVTDEIRVDGHLDEPGWTTAAVISLDWETAPGDNEPAPVRTECHLAYDVSALYLACRAFDVDPGSIRAYIVDRDGTRGHDRIILSLDPFNDARRAFEFGVSAVGVQNESVYDEARASPMARGTRFGNPPAVSMSEGMSSKPPFPSGRCAFHRVGHPRRGASTCAENGRERRPSRPVPWCGIARKRVSSVRRTSRPGSARPIRGWTSRSCPRSRPRRRTGARRSRPGR